MHTSGITNSAVSFSVVGIILNNKESNNIYLSAYVSTLQMTIFVQSNLFWAKYRYMSLKYETTRYPACISFTVTGQCFPLRTFLWIIFNILSVSSCFCKNFCTGLPVLIRPPNSWGSWKYHLSGLWYISDITLSLNGEFSSNSIFSSGSISDKPPGISGIDVSIGLRGGI